MALGPRGPISGVTDPLEELEAEGFETMFKAVATPGTVLGDLWVTASKVKPATRAPK